jgi:hypothetical protein
MMADELTQKLHEAMNAKMMSNFPPAQQSQQAPQSAVTRH